MDWALFGDLIMTALFTALLLGLEHYIPWRRIMGHDIRVPWSYVVGVASLGLPFSAWALGAARPLSGWEVVAGFWTVVAAGGWSVLACYKLDWYLEERAREGVERGRGDTAGGDGRGD
jgi:hypothetical protein